MRSARDGEAALAAELARRGGPLAAALRPEPPADDGHEPGPAQLAAGGPRAVGHELDYELLVEMILEGSRLHYGAGRLLSGEDRDLALLLGDQLYALGLARLAELGDLEAVAELADLISLVAEAEGAGDAALSAAVWRAGAVAIGWGSTREHELAKARAREGAPGAAAALIAGSERPTS